MRSIQRRGTARRQDGGLRRLLWPIMGLVKTCGEVAITGSLTARDEGKRPPARPELTFTQGELN
jgi:hypothetical protein